MGTQAQSPVSVSTCTRCSLSPCGCHTFIGGSEAFELLNQRQYGRGCVRALAYRKQDIAPDFPEQESFKKGLFQRGHRLEQIASEMYMEATGRSLLRTSKLRRHPQHPGAGVHTDRIIVAFDERGTGDAEIKTHSEGPFLRIMREGIPPGHNLQIQWSMWITGHRWGAFVILGVFEELPLKFFDVPADLETHEIFARETDAFWELMEQGELPPPPFPADDLRCKVCPWRLSCRGELIDQAEMQAIMLEKSIPLVAIDDAELEQTVKDYVLVKGEISALTSESKEDPGALQLIQAKLEDLMGDLPGAIVNRQWQVTVQPSVWTGLDTTRLKQDAPALYKKFLVVKRPNGKKRLRVKYVGEKEVAND